MSKLVRPISPLFSLAFTHSRTRAARRWLAELDYCTWGQDRIGRIAEEIRRRPGTPGS